MITALYNEYKNLGFEGELISPSFQSYLSLLQAIEDFKLNAPLKWKRNAYRKRKVKFLSKKK